MTKLPVCGMKGDRLGEVSLSDDLLVLKKGEQAVHDVIEAHRAGLRANTAATKTRGEVEGGSAKPWKQKGTGRARHGSIRSPIWRGGGVVWGPQPTRNYKKKVTRKVARLAFRRAFSEKAVAGEVTVIDGFSVSEPRTKQVAAFLRSLKAERGALLILDRVEDNVRLASRNVPNFEVTTADRVHTYQILRYPRILVGKSAMPRIEQRLKARDGRSS